MTEATQISFKERSGRPDAAQSTGGRSDEELIDVSEKGRSQSGEPIALDRRLFIQFLAFGGVENVDKLAQALETADIHGALYADVNDPQGVGLITCSETPDYFLDTMRPFLNHVPFGELTPKPEYTMLGRTYSIGYEQDLEETLIGRPRRRLLDPNLRWVIWYPLRRSGSFEQLPPQEQNLILMEHGGIGRAYGRVGLGYDVRLACHGLDKNDNDFIVGLLGPDLHPLSSIVQRMRKTKQTSQHLERLGPFFIGRVVWQAKE